jgi:hypothetical protein
MQVQPDRFAVAALACRVTKTKNDGSAMMDYNGQDPVGLLLDGGDFWRETV